MCPARVDCAAVSAKGFGLDGKSIYSALPDTANQIIEMAPHSEVARGGGRQARQLRQYRADNVVQGRAGLLKLDQLSRSLGSAQLDFPGPGSLQGCLGCAFLGPMITQVANIMLACLIEIEAAIGSPLNDLLSNKASDHFAAQQQMPRDFA
jgi:hypothetical protein